MPQTATQTRSDEDIRRSVAHELAWEPQIADTDIAVAVKEGVVTLSGFCHSYWEKGEAARAAKRIYGVKGLANDIEVRPRDSRTDPEIARDAVHELESHTGIPPGKIKVTVINGAVKLEGSVDWQYQKGLAESVTRQLKGVTHVSNEIQIVPRISQPDVQHRIEDALRRSAEIDARRIRVEVDRGTVRLYGNVRSWAEHQDAERAAWSAPGTAKVENHIQIAP